jgi:tetratricopeptide (TPR) repeat protein
MSERARIRREKLLSAAEGYLALDLPKQAIESLDEIEDPKEVLFQWNYLRGEAYRQLERYTAALGCFQTASDEQADFVPLLMAYRIAPKEAVILYNLSCYWSLAGNKVQALSWLGRALRMDQKLRQLIDEESDFNPLRNDPDFQMIVTAGNAWKGPL